MMKMSKNEDAGPTTAVPFEQVGTGNQDVCYSGSLFHRTVYNTPPSEGAVRGGLEGLALVKDWIKRNRSENLKCATCGRPLRAEDLEGYYHNGGWRVPGLPGKQWLYIACRHCGYDSSLAKLGIDDDGTFLNEIGVEVLP